MKVIMDKFDADEELQRENNLHIHRTKELGEREISSLCGWKLRTHCQNHACWIRCWNGQWSRYGNVLTVLVLPPEIKSDRIRSRSEKLLHDMMSRQLLLTAEAYLIVLQSSQGKKETNKPVDALYVDPMFFF